MKGFQFVNNKKIAGVSAAATMAATAVTALLLGATPALADDDGPYDSAYAFSASGLLDIDPLPYVESRDGDLVRDELLGLGERTDAEEAGVFLGVLNVAADHQWAETSVARVELLHLLRADLIRTHCTDDGGGLEIVNGTLLGRELPRFPVPSEEIDLSPLASLTLNHQVRRSDGSLTVTGIELTVLPGAGDGVDETLDDDDRAALPLLGDLLGVDLPTDLVTESDVIGELGGLGALLGGDDALQTVTIGSVTCTDDNDGDDRGDDSKDDSSSDDDDKGDSSSDDDDDSDSAPAPTIVEADLPVTG